MTRIIEARTRDLGGFSVGRVLPAPGFHLVGPFIFFDHMGPADFGPGEGIDVRPHPHIGLATVTYLFEGALRHRDSLGTDMVIRPGAVNWMNAGRGIVHSERTPAPERAAGHRMHGIQSWVALPQADEESAPAFAHHPAETLPTIAFDGARRTLIAGTAFHAQSPVHFPAPMFYIDVEAEAGATVHLPDEHAERALYVADGAIEVEGVRHEARRMLVFDAGVPVHFTTVGPARVMLLGGAPIDAPRHIWWNLVSSDPARIEAAKADWGGLGWREGDAQSRFRGVPGEDEWIPLPPM
ncbi:pirin family protein [Sandaracinobacteroides saxicola]|uniref:Pirin family protein n=1 Tax=Sandaracinobacteroides saxicola TaxID=2759707 RepID=A0A7G5IHZ4_9SPHN|nr:pirin family protein [Sandaracinobacteroides saxicola]QMW22986.1 pirin family protein [Sandaracinobacteroides saxicola]